MTILNQTDQTLLQLILSRYTEKLDLCIENLTRATGVKSGFQVEKLNASQLITSMFQVTTILSDRLSQLTVNIFGSLGDFDKDLPILGS